MQKGEKLTTKRNRSPAAGKTASAVKSIARAAGVLVCLSNGTNTITDIAEDCQLSKSTVHRLLKALEESDLAIRNTINHRYYIGHLITRLVSNPQTTHQYLTSSAIDEMKKLADITEETITLGILLGTRYVMLHEIPSQHSLKVTDVTQQVGPPFMGAPIKTLLSQLDEANLNTAMKIFRASQAADGTEIDFELLLSQLQQIREDGYALSAGERFVGVLGISAPIRNYVFPAVLSIIGPETRLKSKVPGLIEKLKAGANRISGTIAEILK